MLHDVILLDRHILISATEARVLYDTLSHNDSCVADGNLDTTPHEIQEAESMENIHETIHQNRSDAQVNKEQFSDKCHQVIDKNYHFKHSC